MTPVIKGLLFCGCLRVISFFDRWRWPTLMMALAWAKPGGKLEPGLEFRLWREATTIFMTAGHGGCAPYGLAVALKKRGLAPEVYVNRQGPYFLDTVKSESKRRVMRLTQDDFTVSRK